MLDNEDFVQYVFILSKVWDMTDANLANILVNVIDSVGQTTQCTTIPWTPGTSVHGVSDCGPVMAN